MINIRNLVMLSIWCVTMNSRAGERFFLDGIKAVVRGSEGTDLIIASELHRSRLDGTPNTLEGTVMDSLLAQEARKWKLWPTPEENEKQMQMARQMNGKTEKEFEEILTLSGYTLEEGKRAFAQINAVNTLLGYKIAGNLVVPESAVRAYYNDNPVILPAQLLIQYALVPFEQGIDYATQRKQLRDIKTIEWQEPFWIAETDIAADKSFLKNLSIGQVSQPQQTAQGFELFKLVDKKEERLQPLEERYDQIAAALRQPKYTQLLDQFHKKLMEEASIIYFDLPVSVP